MRTSVTRAGVLSATIAFCLAMAASQVQAAPTVGEAAALQHLKSKRQQMGLTGSDINEVAVSSTVLSSHTGVTHVYLQQRHAGIDVWNGIVNVNVAPDGSVISSGNRFVANIAALAGGQNARKSGMDAAAAAAGHLKLKASQPFHVVSRKGGPSEAVTLSDGGIAARPIEARLVWLPVGSGVRLAWSVEIEAAEGDEWVYAFVDAQTGESLGQHSLVVTDSARGIADAIARPAGSPAALPSFDPTDGALYRVFPIPLESPTDGDRQLVVNGANPSASPFGWHDTNGAAGPEFTGPAATTSTPMRIATTTTSRDPGSDPDGGASLTFDFPLDLAPSSRSPRKPAIVTNLFYWNNIVHDVTLPVRLRRAWRQLPGEHYGRGGLGNDDVNAEAQDGSGRNNANFGTPRRTASRPRMQMFEWRSATPNPITVLAPSPIAGTYYGPMAGFGESLDHDGCRSAVTVVAASTTAAPPAGDRQRWLSAVHDSAGLDPAHGPRRLQLHREGQERAERRRRRHRDPGEQHRWRADRHGRGSRPDRHDSVGHRSASTTPTCSRPTCRSRSQRR